VVEKDYFVIGCIGFIIMWLAYIYTKMIIVMQCAKDWMHDWVL